MRGIFDCLICTNRDKTSWKDQRMFKIYLAEVDPKSKILDEGSLVGGQWMGLNG